MKNSYMKINKVSPCERKRQQLRYNYKQFVNRGSVDVPVVSEPTFFSKIKKILSGEK